MSDTCTFFLFSMSMFETMFFTCMKSLVCGFYFEHGLVIHDGAHFKEHKSV